MKKPQIIKLGDDLQINLDPKLVVIAVVVVVIGAWFALGGPVYTVAPEEEGVIQTFGKYTKTTSSGLHIKFPWPVQTVEKPNIAEVNRLEFGYRSETRRGATSFEDFTTNEYLLEEAEMLTGDENVVNCSMTVRYQIGDSRKYLFNFRGPAEVREALRDIGEAALRQAVGDRPIDYALTTGKFEIQLEVQSRMETLIDLYGMGLRITNVMLKDVRPPRQVEAAFKDVATAREEREKFKNEALGYQNEQVPRAEGEARSMILGAEGYRDAQITEAQGQADRFLALAGEFEASPEVARARLYLEAMTELLPKLKITVIDEAASLLNIKTLGANAGLLAQPPSQPVLTRQRANAGQRR